jgi:hypothetical protein
MLHFVAVPILVGQKKRLRIRGGEAVPGLDNLREAAALLLLQHRFRLRN